MLDCSLKIALPPAEVQRLSAVEQAEAVYALLGRVVDALADLGFDPSVVANVASNLASELVKRDSGPAPPI